MLEVLRQNAENLRVYSPYDSDWKKLSSELRLNGCCQRCGKQEQLVVHHIIPVKSNGTRERDNLTVLCISCHTTVEFATKKIFEIIPDWNTAKILIRERLSISENLRRLFNTGGFITSESEAKSC